MNVRERIYAGLLGMNAGIRLGAPLEPPHWTPERIREVYGEIDSYVAKYQNFAADDDANGPYYFFRAVIDDFDGDMLRPQDVARAWLNYTRDGRGMFWWGGYGVSTEHTAYQNLKEGIPAPQSGSIAQNGRMLAEQIGGQIFIDTWGLVWPGNPQKAADFAQAAASVSHDGEGLYGPRFFAAAIAAAFVESSIERVIDVALAQIPADSLYAAVFRAVSDFHAAHPEDWRACRAMLEAEWGYDRYAGVCHMIPNAGVCALALRYGAGDLARTIEIATMCGWDTDCNAGNVGTVLGVWQGIDGIPDRYRAPIGDFLAMSGISGELNIVDIPSFARELHAWAKRLAGEGSLDEPSAAMHLDFDLPGSTHGMRISDPIAGHIAHAPGQGVEGSGAIVLTFTQLEGGQRVKVYHKPYYERADFDDERYDPVFTPRVWSGQRFAYTLRAEGWVDGVDVAYAPYVRLAGSRMEICGAWSDLPCGAWRELDWILPDADGDLIDEFGLIVESRAPFGQTASGRVWIDEIRVTGQARYAIDFAKQRVNFGNPSPFSVNDRGCGAFALEAGGLHAFSSGLCEAYTGRYHARDCRVEAPVTPLSGGGHMLCLRAQGAMRGYFAGLSDAGHVAIVANDFGLTELASAPFGWRDGQTYAIAFEAIGGRIALSIDGQTVLTCRDDRFAYGMVGCVRTQAGRCVYGKLEVEER